MQNKILWERFLPSNIEEEDEEDESEYDNESNMGFSPLMNMPREVDVVKTPIGIMAIDDANKMFNYWIGHTNFELDEFCMEVIDSVEGVEEVDFLTKYRFRVLIGKAFEDKDVRFSIQAAFDTEVDYLPKMFNDYEPSREILDKKDIMEDLVSKKKYWGIYILPNGEMDAFSTDDQKEALGFYTKFVSAREVVGGSIYTSKFS